MEYKDTFYSEILCATCIHHFLNNGESSKHGCRAFPDGIPEEAKCGNNHLKKINGQVGDFVYKRARYEELSPVGKALWNLRNRPIS